MSDDLTNRGGQKRTSMKHHRQSASKGLAAVQFSL